ncbi:uncharacterized protein LOC123475738 [Daphnia magna]|uniref:uncharacterized protein LOC123475738 n=1 Tax=Daphnia magna TaxID=35525 RepID=UPI001E1BB24B|nr:uncharacterized protein LOC123475738 [Daphnia magna]
MELQKHAFAIVDLFATNGTYVHVVRTTWIITGNTQYLVPKHHTYEAHIRKTEKPESDWILYPCHVRKGYDSYETARRHLAEATVNSEINSTDVEVNAIGRGHRKKIGNKRYSPYEEKRPSIEIDGEDSEDSSVGFYGPTQSLLPTIPIPRHLMASTSNPMEEGMMSTNSRQDPTLISERNLDSWDMTEEQSAISNITIQPKDLTQSTSNSIQESRKKILGRIHLIESKGLLQLGGETSKGYPKARSTKIVAN